VAAHRHAAGTEKDSVLERLDGTGRHLEHGPRPARKPRDLPV